MIKYLYIIVKFKLDEVYIKLKLNSANRNSISSSNRCYSKFQSGRNISARLLRVSNYGPVRSFLPTFWLVKTKDNKATSVFHFKTFPYL